MDSVLDKVVASLTRLHRMDPSSFENIEMGICCNLDKLLNPTGGEWQYDTDLVVNGYYIVNYFSRGWAYHTGYSAYPIIRSKPCLLWTGKQLKLRQDLIQYMIRRINAYEGSYKDAMEDLRVISKLKKVH